ncbi:MAG: hypothetical protein L0K41_11190 [Yaniella sp.]|uniref:hypothetical protein n=1 Tax=Yaniella sp. TaxID=2773929 RepID=UPI002649E23C|nr:hypothetical protein [Yaniella sp.]MDN5731198.1 hypothetical protein [Yaniella sp.]MDN5815069.1 hypothetical protein [Yaniella sp.]MDN5838946.1 hypothetical protein [Yaniella sp.]MDN5890262.1 hypothetical protein [Yaniella sp.]MDN5911949.1 hypothetical protein [Yaniella sp.]
MTTILTATAVALEPNRTHPGAYVVTVKCPYCPAQHRHGITELEPDAGHRVTDCIPRHVHTPNSRGYFIHVPQRLRHEVSA